MRKTISGPLKTYDELDKNTLLKAILANPYKARIIAEVNIRTIEWALPC